MVLSSEKSPSLIVRNDGRETSSSLALSGPPCREMANVFSKEFAAAFRKEIPFVPRAVPKIHGKPWTPPLRPHERAIEYWSGAFGA